jgi:hypothetical protein
MCTTARGSLKLAIAIEHPLRPTSLTPSLIFCIARLFFSRINIEI